VSLAISSFSHDCIITLVVLGRTLEASHKREADAMHVQIVNFQLNGIDDSQYRAACEEEAATFAAIPGLLSKIWLADPETNTYGGVYIWRDRQSMQTFISSDLFQGITADPQVKNVTSRDFDVLETPTEVARGIPGARV
jgi:putative monooxygenase ydhR